MPGQHCFYKMACQKTDTAVMCTVCVPVSCYVFVLSIVAGLELQMAKSEFAQKEEELTRAFAKVESLLDELGNLQKQKVSSASGEQKQEIELHKLQLELEVSKWNDRILKRDQNALFL